MGPVAQAEGHDGPGLSLQLVPGVAAVINDSVDIVEHAVGQPVLAQELPYVLLGVQLGTLRRQWDDGDVVWHHELAREVPTSLVKQQCCVVPRRHIGGDRREMQVHHRGIAPGQDQADGLALLGTDSAEDVGGGGALVR